MRNLGELRMRQENAGEGKFRFVTEATALPIHEMRV